MKVIFLDIDGVLTHTDYLNWQTRHIDPERVRFLAKIVELTDAQIVLTSTWKDGYDRQSGKKDDYYVVLERVLAEHDLKIYDITDNIPEEVLEQIPSVISLDQLDIHCKHGTGRAAEVEKWMERQRQTVPIAGINRAENDLTVQDGCCETLHNLRYDAGAWRNVETFRPVAEITDFGGFSI